MKRPPRGWAEQDAFTGWRFVLHWRAGERKGIKRKANRRDRRLIKSQLKSEVRDDS